MSESPPSAKQKLLAILEGRAVIERSAPERPRKMAWLWPASIMVASIATVVTVLTIYMQPVEHVSDALRIQQLRMRPMLYDSEVEWLRERVNSGDTLERRHAVSILLKNNHYVPASVMVDMLKTAPAEESIAFPDEVAGTGDDAATRRARYYFTVQSALSGLATLVIKHNERCDPAIIEPFVTYHVREIRRIAVFVLGWYDDYVLPPHLRRAILEDHESVQTSAKKLLET